MLKKFGQTLCLLALAFLLMGANPSGNHEGYTLFKAQNDPHIYLIDAQGRVINQWEASDEGRDAILQENGNLLVTVRPQNPDPENFAATIAFADIDGRFEEYTWDGDLVWEYEFNDPLYRIHHGVEVLPNGNIMFLVWEYISPEEAIENGRDPDFFDEDEGQFGLWPDAVIELDRETNEVVWVWRVWDHLVQDFDETKANFGDVAASPHLIDVNFQEASTNLADWIHANAIDYHPELDQIAISAREFHEVWIVDHSISTEEAAGPAGDLLYRWGNPRAYRQGDETDKYYFFQHDVQWVPQGLPGAGNIIAYSNRHPTDDPAIFYSTVVEFTPPLLDDGTYALEDGVFGPAEPLWTYGHDQNDRFASIFLSGVQRLPIGTTLVTEGQANHIFKVQQNGERTWQFRLPEGMPVNVFRARRYQPDYPAFEGRDLTPGGHIAEVAIIPEPEADEE